jgi:CubicO group peptidase (beta-lactamase class C family)
MRLVEAGKMKLDDHVLGSDLTVDELLKHVSGLPRSTYIAEGITDADEAAARILAQPRGEKGKFAYSNEGYTLLAIAAEKAGDAPFFELLRREVLEPAGLRQTGFWPGCVPGIRVAKLSRPPEDARARENWGFKGAEGICSTAHDLARFMTAVDRGGLLHRPWELFMNMVPLEDGFAGRGFFVSTRRTTWTRGTEDYGHNGIVKLRPNGTLIVALSDVPAVRRDDVPQSRALADELEATLSWP